jgi:hypothetical protein
VAKKSGMSKYALPAIVVVAAVGGFVLYKKHQTKQAARARAYRAIMRMRGRGMLARRF